MNARVPPLPLSSLSAVVLAGGRSRRMGRDKALLEIDGRPAWQRQREVLAAAGAGEIFLSARADQAWTREAGACGFSAVLHDAIAFGGPMVGLTAALERASGTHVAVLAIDLPLMTPGWFATLWAQCAAGVGAVGQRDGFFEPLAAIYPRELIPLAWEALVRGEYALQPLLRQAVEKGMMRGREISAEDRRRFENRNEPFAAETPQA